MGEVGSIILEVRDSNSFADDYPELLGSGPTEEGYFAGFQVYLDNRIFPVPTDRFTEVTFTTVVAVLYEGFSESKPERRILTTEFRASGKDELFLTTNVKVGGPLAATNFEPCDGNVDLSMWTVQMIVSQDTKQALELVDVVNQMYVLTESTNQLSLAESDWDSPCEDLCTLVLKFEVTENFVSHETMWSNLELSLASNNLYVKNHAPFYTNNRVERVVCSLKHDPNLVLDENISSLSAEFSLLLGLVYLII